MKTPSLKDTAVLWSLKIFKFSENIYIYFSSFYVLDFVLNARYPKIRNLILI